MDDKKTRARLLLLNDYLTLHSFSAADCNEAKLGKRGKAVQELLENRGCN